MKQIFWKIIILISLGIFISGNIFAEKNINSKNKSGNSNKSTKSIAAGCVPATTSTDLDLNNVRALIHTGGDMWWDLQGTAKYEVPKGSGKTAFFAGSIWIGGKDINGQLKVAALQFRSNGTDYWPGPLIVDGADRGNVSAEICAEYDKHFVITREEVAKFRTYINATLNGTSESLGEEFDSYAVPTIIEEWPAHGPAGGYDYYLAPFYDANDDGVYNYMDGDYPFYDLDGSLPCGTSRELRLPRLFGDQTIWWVYNDKGNIHTESNGDPIGMEIRAQGFAFATNDELNNMTFYNYQLLNRSTFTMYDTYFGVWSDADMGYAFDDYVGCDVSRGLGYLYNGKAVDGDGQTYAYGGPNPPPPAIGVDFFEGPYMDDDYGTDRPDGGCDASVNGLNFGDGIKGNERWGMRRFIYYNNDESIMGNPDNAVDYYNYLDGVWLDGNRMVYGGTGHPSDADATDVETNFMFPRDTDPCGWGQPNGDIMDPWDEESEENPADDRRFVQSAGPFTLEPGAVNDITVGVVWARASSGTPFSSVEEVRRADDKAQLLFENCFKVVDGPDAPELDIIEMDQKLIFHISNTRSSNNYLEKYAEDDPFIVCPEEDEDCDRQYTFEGYQVFQLASEDVSISDIYDIDLAREVFQCDVKNGISKLVNYEWDDDYGANIPTIMVDGADEGIEHTFELTTDAFATGSNTLVNHKKYYYLIIAYAYNEYLNYDQNDPLTVNGQKTPYKAGRKGAIGAISTYEAIPHFNKNENEGTIINGEFGYGPKITQIEGHGHGNNILELTQETKDEIMSGAPWKATAPEYENGMGPIQVKVIDPLNIPEDVYTIMFDSIGELIGFTYIPPIIDSSFYGLITDAKWYIFNTTGDTIFSDEFISVENEQIFPEWGFSINIAQTNLINFDNAKMAHLPQPDNHGVLSSEVIVDDPLQSWLTFIYDGDGYDDFNWIRVGTQSDETSPAYNDYQGEDEDEYYETVLNGSWAPYIYTSDYYNGPAWELMRSVIKFNESRIPSVDVVITSDKSKWTRCVVIEMADNDSIDGSPSDLSVDPDVLGGVEKFDKRMSPSVDKEGNFADTTAGVSTDPNSPNYISNKGMGWFPGYAIDVETGERLNIMFGEDSRLMTQNGRDMLWNPTEDYATDLYWATGGTSGDLFFGGKHYIYIMGHNHIKYDKSYYMPTYDEGKFIDSMLTRYDGEPAAAYAKRKKQVYRNASWVSLPMLVPDAELLATDVEFKLRVANPYKTDKLSFIKNENSDLANNGGPVYQFNTNDIKTITGDISTAQNALDLIRVVPNPYYGYSEYELNQLENLVKITNLPRKCTVSIFTYNGTLIRRFEKDNSLTYQEWDLKNQYGIAISSGVYIFHIEADGIGEKVLKWFGSLRPTDLNAF